MGWKTFKPNRLVCPHCGYDGTTSPYKYENSRDYDVPPFYWLEDTTEYWPVLAVAGKAVEKGTIQMSDESEIDDLLTAAQYRDLVGG